ncbi:hypothetical protein ANN_26713 [Periplaneta americana]|uniref:Uncharacterized protein n=1 Tax=Periplaneta americana TaxID=6978 RepID=A0ABQ8RYU5_PERAM|nr:hypothetical protein ANN_26713 [Periplaneta americana]
MSVGKTSPKRMVYQLAKETFYTEGLRKRMLLPSMDLYFEHLKRRETSKGEIDPDFYAINTVLERNWTKENQEQRHVLTRLVIPSQNIQ